MRRRTRIGTLRDLHIPTQGAGTGTIIECGLFKLLDGGAMADAASKQGESDTPKAASENGEVLTQEFDKEWRIR